MVKVKEKQEAPSYTIDGKALAMEMAPTLDSIVEKKLSERLRDIKDTHDPNDDIDCPTCHGHNGHSHKLKNNGNGRLVCTGPECKEEYHIISANPDVQCESCGVPLKRPPKELENSLTCPLCGKDHFREFNKKKIKR